jgi:hypothetical protein
VHSFVNFVVCTHCCNMDMMNKDAEGEVSIERLVMSLHEILIRKCRGGVNV